MMKWVTKFIDENKEIWEEEQIEKEMVAMQEVYEWNKANRMEKIRKLKSKDITKLEMGEQRKREERVTQDWETWRENKEMEEDENQIETIQAKVGVLKSSNLAPLPITDEESLHKDSLVEGERIRIDNIIDERQR